MKAWGGDLVIPRDWWEITFTSPYLRFRDFRVDSTSFTRSDTPLPWSESVRMEALQKGLLPGTRVNLVRTFAWSCFSHTLKAPISRLYNITVKPPTTVLVGDETLSVGRSLQRGTFGEVFAVRSSSGAYALKICSSDPPLDNSEASVLSIDFILMERCAARVSILTTPSEVMALGKAVMSALQSIHACGLTYGDLKYFNVMKRLDDPVSKASPSNYVLVDLGSVSRPGCLNLFSKSTIMPFEGFQRERVGTSGERTREVDYAHVFVLLHTLTHPDKRHPVKESPPPGGFYAAPIDYSSLMLGPTVVDLTHRSKAAFREALRFLLDGLWRDGVGAEWGRFLETFGCRGCGVVPASLEVVTRGFGDIRDFMPDLPLPLPSPSDFAGFLTLTSRWSVAEGLGKKVPEAAFRLVIKYLRGKGTYLRSATLTPDTIPPPEVVERPAVFSDGETFTILSRPDGDNTRILFVPSPARSSGSTLTYMVPSFGTQVAEDPLWELWFAVMASLFPGKSLPDLSRAVRSPHVALLHLEWLIQVAWSSFPILLPFSPPESTTRKRQDIGAWVDSSAANPGTPGESKSGEDGGDTEKTREAFDKAVKDLEWQSRCQTSGPMVFWTVEDMVKTTEVLVNKTPFDPETARILRALVERAEASLPYIQGSSITAALEEAKQALELTRR